SVEPSVSEYESFFARNLTLANHVIHIAMSSKVGKGYERATEAARSFDNVTVIDSWHLSSGMGLLVLEAIRMADESRPYDEIIRTITDLRNKVRTSFIISDTEYLARAGRLSPTVNSIARALLFRPVLVLSGGRMGVGKVYFGAKEACADKYIHSALGLLSGIDKRKLFITYAGMSMEELRRVKDVVEKRVQFDEIIFQKASSAITANCGPGTFGLLYITK
ncbi:MAG: DegV family EDD domain-containing protein, partial [Lachnospiraceae bacterium]|nr:DegV family EDD domain-containing protein [Lachnospiraceae bacterium]